jgi:hypothetical protein
MDLATTSTSTARPSVLLTAYFTMVARDRATNRALQVPRLLCLDEREKKVLIASFVRLSFMRRPRPALWLRAQMFAEGDRKREERKEAQIKSLDRSPPHADELEVVRWAQLCREPSRMILQDQNIPSHNSGSHAVAGALACRCTSCSRTRREAMSSSHQAQFGRAATCAFHRPRTLMGKSSVAT